MKPRKYPLSKPLLAMSCLLLSFPYIACQTSASRSGNRNQIPSSGTQNAGTANSSRPGATNSRLAWTQFQDPMEQAFSLDVPRGWSVSGGLFRIGFSDIRPMVDMRSPDGKIDVRLGDVAIPSYMIPDQLHNQEGQPYDLGAQAQMVVAKYHPGPEFAVLYSHSRFGRSCPNPQPMTSPADFSMPDYLPADTTSRESSSGQIAYRCDTDAGPRVAFAFTKTANYGTLWQVPQIVSYLAPPDQTSAAADIVRHCAQSFRVNPQWMEYQKRMDAEGLQYQRARQQGRIRELQQQVQQFEAKMRAMQDQVNSFEAHQAQQANQVDGFLDALNGVTPTVDPLTGESRKVWTGTQSNYWVNGAGQVVNSNSNPDPNQSWRQLQVPPN